MTDQHAWQVTATPELNVGYVHVTDHPVALTRELGDGLLVDYDADGAVIGVETLTLDQHVSPRRHRASHRKGSRMSVRSLSFIDEATGRFSAWIDSTYPDGMQEDLVVHRRVGKVAEEVGEVTAAIGGYFAENPRKGQSHTIDDLQGELLDVAFAALGAWEHLNGNTGAAGTALLTRLRNSPWNLASERLPTADGDLLEELNQYLLLFTDTLTHAFPGSEPAELSLRRRHADLVQMTGTLARELTVHTTVGMDQMMKAGLQMTLLNIAVYALSIHENTASRGTTISALTKKIDRILTRAGELTAT